MRVYDKVKKIIFCFCIIWLAPSWAFARRNTSEGNTYTLQIISDAYRKQPYIQAPTAWIAPKDRIQIVQSCRKIVQSQWTVQEIQLTHERMQKEKWLRTLKCHPAVTLTFNPNNPQKTSKQEFYMVMIYPKSYRSLVEDPLIKTPIQYLGSAGRLAFYCYTYKDAKKSPIDTIVTSLKIKKRN